MEHLPSWTLKLSQIFKMRVWVIFHILFAPGISLPIELSLKNKVGKLSEGILESLWHVPKFPSSDEDGNIGPYDTIFSSWQSGAPDFHMLAELPPQMGIPRIQVMCNTTHLRVHVNKQFNGVELSRKELQLGEGCHSNGDLKDQLLFTYHPSRCGTNRVTSNGQVVLSNLLHFNPKDSLVTWWSTPFTIPISCIQERSKVGPTAQLLTSLSSTENWGFSLNAMHPSWARPEKLKIYHRGQIINLQVTARPGLDQQLFIQSCFVSTFADPVARPRVGVIVNKGCTASIGPERAAVAQFVAFRHVDTVNLILDTSLLQTEVYLHCGVVISDRSVSSDLKSCNYNEQKSRWEELSGDVDVCSCCTSKCKGTSNGHIAAKAVVSTGPLLIVDRVPTQPQPVVREPNQSSSPLEDSSTQSGASDPGVTVYMTSGATGLAESGASFSGSSLVGNPVPNAPWSSPSVMAEGVVVISQDQGGTLTMWLPGQVQVNDELGRGGFPVLSSGTPAELFLSSSMLNYDQDVNQLYPQDGPTAEEQKGPPIYLSMDSVRGTGPKGADSENSIMGMNVYDEWKPTLDLRTSLSEESQEKRWSGRPRVPGKSVPTSYKMMVKDLKPLDYMPELNLLEDIYYDKMGDNGLVLVMPQNEVNRLAEGPVISSKLQLSQAGDGSQSLSYEEKVRHPRLREDTTFGMEGNTPAKRLQGKGLVLSFLEMLRRLDKAE